MENTSAQNQSSLPLVLKLGAIFLAFEILSVLIQYYTGWMEQGKGGWVGWAFFALKAVIAIILVKQFRNTRLGGYITFGKAFSITWLSYLASGVIGVPFNVIFYRILHPEVTAKMLKLAEEKMLASGMTDDQVEGSMKLSKMMSDSTAITTASHIIYYIFAGLILGIIVAPFCKKEGGEFMGA